MLKRLTIIVKHPEFIEDFDLLGEFRSVFDWLDCKVIGAHEEVLDEDLFMDIFDLLNSGEEEE